MLRIDHVVYATGDLDRSAERFRRDLGLDSTPGGRHPAWGTANRIVPLGEGYLELVAIVEPATAERSTFGRLVAERAEGWAAICVATNDLDATASRLGLEVSDGRRDRPDGTAIRWRSAGVEDPRREPWMPFFIEWAIPSDLHPGRARAGHGVRPSGIAWVEVGGDASRLRDWLGDEELPIRVVDAVAGIRAAAIATAEGEIEIR